MLNRLRISRAAFALSARNAGLALGAQPRAGEFQDCSAKPHPFLKLPILKTAL